MRIFPDGRDPQSGASNAEDRRLARGMRRRRDRYVARQTKLMAQLVTHGLMPADAEARKALEALDPYVLRAKALDDALPAHHVGRALFALNQRRGFLSNRKSAGGKDDDKGAIKDGARKLGEAMERTGARTLGEFLSGLHRRREPVRARNVSGGAKATYNFYPTRALVEREFQAIWAAQAPHHGGMTPEAQDSIHESIFFQRPLKPPIVGKCTLDPASGSADDDPDGYRAPWAHPLAQRFRIFHEVRNLEVGETGSRPRKLTKAEGDIVALALLQNNKVSFDKMRGLLKLPPEARFNIESEKRSELKGDETAERLGHKNRFGKTWRGYALERQTMLVDHLMNEADDDAVIAWLIADCGVEAQTAARIADAPLPEGYCRLGLRAIRKILPFLEAGADYARAAEAAGYHHSRLETGEILDRLPYYGAWLPDAVVGSGDPHDGNEKRYGRFPNPTVHIGLGQLRRVVNELIDRFGPPQEVVIEFTRALKLSPDQKEAVRRDQRRNQDKNTARIKDVRDLLGNEHYDPSPADLLKMRLWEELNSRDPLDRKCPFSGESISLSRLLSAEVEIEHLIPYAISLDDSAANKTVCLRETNRAKRNRTPHQAFGGSPHPYDWDAIAQRASSLPRNKAWRFEPDAHDKFKDIGGFLSRQLNETGWLARVAKQYLAAVCGPNAIWVIPGKLTAMIRGKWGLNSLLPDHNYAGVKERDETFRAAMDDMEFAGVKNRADHRHHAIDAFVAALTSRSLLQRMASVYDEERDKIVVPDPWDGFREELRARLDDMLVSHKPDHGVAGKLHEDTAYGFVADPSKEGGNLVRRKDFLALSENEVELIRDIRLREMVRDYLHQAKAHGIDHKRALRNFADTADRDAHTKHGIRKVRLLKVEKSDYLVPVADSTGKPYKAYSAGENHCVEIFETEPGRWQGEAVRRFDANQDAYRPRWRTEHPGARLVMRIHKGDLVRIEHEGRTRVMVVHRLDAAAGRFKLADHNETGNLDRRHAMDNAIDPFRWVMASYGTLQKAGAVRIRVDELGRAWRIDPPAGGR